MAFRFGILGTGNIAKQFAASLATSTRCVVTGVGSRSIDSARAFVSGQNLAAAAMSYEDLLRSPDVDGIYLSLPNSLHAEWTMKALKAGKHVLCEKPMATSVAEAERMYAAADAAGKLLVEAFMYVSHPLTQAYVSAIRSGRIGTVRHIRTSFCYRTNKVAGNVRFDPSLGGGALMDIGCYCLHFSRMIAGEEPVEIAAHGRRHSTGVDEQLSGLLRFPSGLTATFTAGMSLQADNTATISGDEGYIEVPVPWKPPVTGAKWVIGRSTPPKMDSSNASTPPPPPREEFTVDAGKGLYALEADDFAAAALGERPPAVSRSETLGNVRAIERVAALIR